MGNENVIAIKKLNFRYIIAIIFMLLFVLSDLLFDFAFSFKESDFIAFIFTILSAIIVFFGTWKVKKDEHIKGYYKATKFIKSNFDNAQVVFSILDIVCGVISLLSGYFFLSYTFKIVKIFYIPTKIIVVINKERSLLKPIVKFSYLWTAMRILEKKGGNMIDFLKRNKWTLILGTILGGASAFITYLLIPHYFAIPLYGLILCTIGAFALVFAICYFLGYDNTISAFFRLKGKKLPKEECNNIIAIAASCIKKVAEKKAKEEEEAKIKAEAIRRINAEKAEEEAKAKAEAKKAAEEAKAKEDADKKAKNEEQAQVVKVQEDNAKAEYEAKVQAMINQLKQENK